MFRPLTQDRGKTAAAACADAVRGAILGGKLAPGERLPPERELAESFGASRVTVRSALAQLEASGLLSVRQGSGYVVRDYREHAGPDLLAELLAAVRDPRALRDGIEDLLALRRALADVLIARLVERATPAGLARIEGAIAKLAEVAAANGGPDAAAEADLGVARALVAAAESAVLSVSLNPLLTVVTEVPELRRAAFAHPERNAAAYRMLLELLRQGRGPEARAAAHAALEELDRATVHALPRRKKR